MEEVEMKEMTEEVLNYLKNCKVIAETDGQSMKAYVAEVTRGDRVLGVDDEGFKLLTGVDVATLRRVYSSDNYSTMVTYNKADNGVRIDCILFDNELICNNALTHYAFPEDFLKTFPLADTSIGNETQNTDSISMFFKKSAEDVKKYLKDNYDDYSELVDLFNEDVDKEDIADTWIEENPGDAFDKAVRNISSYDLKDRIKDAIDEL